MNYDKMVAKELERSGLESVFGFRVVSMTGDMVSLVAHDGGKWHVSAPRLLACWRGTRNGWALDRRVTWQSVIADLAMAAD